MKWQGTHETLSSTSAVFVGVDRGADHHGHVADVVSGTVADILMAKKSEFPKTLYVKIETLEEGGDDPFFTAFENMYGIAEQGETIKVATYRLICIDDVELVLSSKKSVE